MTEGACGINLSPALMNERVGARDMPPCTAAQTLQHLPAAISFPT
jgi:hypothetical protein